jgi:leucyl-tRNA synthetase
MAEELWQQLGHEGSVAFAPYPEYHEEYTVVDTVKYPVSFNGKTRFIKEFPASMDKAEIESAVRTDPQTLKYVGAGQIVKVIVVPGRIVNIVIR